MTQDEIIRMVREAGFYVTDNDILKPEWNKLVALVAAHEREACAKVCEDIGEISDGYGCAASIRARGEK